MKYTITESKLIFVVGNLFSKYVTLENLEAVYDTYYVGSGNWLPRTDIIRFIDRETDSFVFSASKPNYHERKFMGDLKSFDVKPKQEDFHEYSVVGFDLAMVPRFDSIFGQGNWEFPLMEYINKNIGTNFSEYEFVE